MGLRKRSKVTAEFNMSSLTDIIFLLLIFFMLTSSLTSPNFKNLARPQSSSTTPSPQNIALSVTPEGEYYIESEQISFEELADKLDEYIAKEKAENLEKNIDEEITVVLNVDMEEPTKTIVRIMSISNDKGVRLILATDP